MFLSMQIERHGMDGRFRDVTAWSQKSKQVINSLLTAFFFLGMVMTGSSNAQGTTLKVTQKLVIPIDLDPTDIRRGADGNYVVVGTLVDAKSDLGLPAAAIKLTPDGKLIWKYASPLTDPKRYPATPQSYTNSIEMDDGSVFLCGHLFNVPEIGAKKAALLLTHLGSDGNLIDEKYYPLAQYQNVGDCAKWGDGFVVWGGYKEVSPDGAKDFSDIRNFDKNGLLTWEKKFELPQGTGGGGQFVSNGSLFLLSENYIRNPKDQTASEFSELEIRSISLNGELKVHKPIHGFLGAWGKIVEPTVRSNDSDIYMIGVTKPGEYGTTNPNQVVVRLNADMQEIIRKEIATFPWVIGFKRVFSQPDGSLFYFGSVAKPFSNLPHMGVAYTNPDLSDQSNLAIDIDDFDVLPYVNVVTPTGTPNQFVTVNRMHLKGFYKDVMNRVVNTDIEKKFPVSITPGTYLVLQFIQLVN
jgi:hypothetical protein